LGSTAGIEDGDTADLDGYIARFPGRGAWSADFHRISSGIELGEQEVSLVVTERARLQSSRPIPYGYQRGKRLFALRGNLTGKLA
jgi:hypothetical protein